MIEIRSASELGGDVRQEVGRVFVDGFGEHFRYFSKNPAVVSAAFAHMFVLDVFHIALVDGTVAGIAACTDGTVSSVEPRADDLKRHFGCIKGAIAHRVLVREFVTRRAIGVGNRTASIEFVATSAAYRRQGVASALMKHIIETAPFDSFVVEVADVNAAAIRLYQEIGFRELRRVPELRYRAWISAVNARLYMTYTKPALEPTWRLASIRLRPTAADTILSRHG